MPEARSPYGKITGSAIQATSSTAVQLGGAKGVPARTILLRAPKTNTAAVFIGDSTVTSVPGGNVFIDLQPGEAFFLDLGNTNMLWAVSAAAQSVYFTALGGGDV